MLTKSIKKQVQKSLKKTETKPLRGDRLFIGCVHGSVQEFSITSKKLIHDYGRILSSRITSMAKTLDNKS